MKNFIQKLKEIESRYARYEYVTSGFDAMGDSLDNELYEVKDEISKLKVIISNQAVELEKLRKEHETQVTVLSFTLAGTLFGFIILFIKAF